MGGTESGVVGLGAQLGLGLGLGWDGERHGWGLRLGLWLALKISRLRAPMVVRGRENGEFELILPLFRNG